VARETGARTRGRIASEALLTMWLWTPYSPEAASQNVAMVTKETAVRSVEGWTTRSR
jgi:hypothetical protein